jgi:hypothetical protein
MVVLVVLPVADDHARLGQGRLQPTMGEILNYGLDQLFSI